LKKVLAVALLLLAAACGTTKQPSGAKYYSDDGPPQRVPENLASIPDAVPRDEPFHKFANRPYTVFGQTYVPVLNKEGFKQRGIASWYGKKFHGNKTASGEVYDMFAMTAAHPTLPIPSYARVTNLRSGETVVVRVNDRGPFHSNRIIDLSYAAAARIGIASPGSGMVEVERVFAGRVAPPPVVQVAAAPPVVETPVVVEDPAGIWLQLGAFGSRDGAEAFREHVARELDWYREPITIYSRDGLHRVRIGPCANRDEAAAIAAKVSQTLGFPPTITGR
jgi:peptidoglycan lytic transglycosylase